jgi:hypothetical protein
MSNINTHESERELDSPTTDHTDAPDDQERPEPAPQIPERRMLCE